MKPNASAFSIGRSKRESEAFQKLQVPGPGSYLNEVKEKIILHDGAYRTPGGKIGNQTRDTFNLKNSFTPGPCYSIEKAY